MKIKNQLVVLAALACLVGDADAQSRSGRGRQRQNNGYSQSRPSGQMRGGFKPNSQSQNLLLKALDVNGNLEISDEELQLATKSLLALDRNGDGRLSANEMRNGTGSSPSFKNPKSGPSSATPMPGHPLDSKQQFIENEVARVLGLDSNKDGKITEPELLMKNKTLFEQVDTNQDNVLVRSELVAEAELLWEDLNRSRRARAGPPPGPGSPPR